MSEYHLLRPGISLAQENSINAPVYPFRFEKPKVGDKVWVIVKNEDDDYAIDTDTIAEISDFYDISVSTYNHRKAILSHEIEWPVYEGKKVEIELGTEPIEQSNYLIDFWLTSYHNGHANCFGETLYSSFEEARSVLVQYFTSDHTAYNEVLQMTEEQLKPEIHNERV